MKKIIALFGGTGLIGTSIISNTNFKEYFFYVYARSDLNSRIALNSNNFKIIKYKYINGEKIENLENCDSIINLAGASIGSKRWTHKYKKILYDSRIETTKKIITEIKKNDFKPKTFINISATGIYGFRNDEELSENSNLGNDFLAKLCADWEKEVQKAEVLGIRTIILRTGIVLSKRGGALGKFITPYKFFIGGYHGSGRQWLPWIHLNDLNSIIKESLTNLNFNGIINCVSPIPVTNKEFSKTLGKVMKKPSVFRVPGLVLKFVLGEFASSILYGQKVLPGKLLYLNFKFQFPKLENALENLLLNTK